jgi:transposase
MKNWFVPVPLPLPLPDFFKKSYKKTMNELNIFLMEKLSHLEKENLKSRHKNERDKRVCDRIKAVLLHDEGWSYSQIAHVLLLNDETVRQHIQDFQLKSKLKPENGGSNSKLNDQQIDAFLLHLRRHTYLYAKDIITYVRTNFGVEYTVAGITAWLHQHRFSYKKPAVVPGKANREAQEQWIRDYEVLKRTLSPAETICFIDGVHPTHNTKSAYGWIQRGERKEILTIPKQLQKLVFGQRENSRD